MSKKLHDEALNRIREQYLNLGPIQLASEFGVTPNSITKAANRMGLISRKKPGQVTQDVLDAIRDRYTQEGPSLLAKQFDLGEIKIGQLANTMGLKTNSGHKRWGVERSNKSTSCNIHYFKTWTPDMSYILGFAFADGNISKDLISLSFLIHQQDLDILTAVKTSLDSKHKISLYPASVRSGRNTGPRASFCVTNKVLVRDLVHLHGIHPAKTYRDDPFPYIPDELIPHFVRGFFDGDGTAAHAPKRRGAVGFCGTKQFLLGLREHIVKWTGLCAVPVLQSKTAVHTLTWQSDAALQVFHSFLYPPGDYIFGKRKKAKLELLISQMLARRASNKRLSYQSPPSLPTPLPFQENISSHDSFRS